MNPIKLIKLMSFYHRLEAIQKEKLPMNAKVVQCVSLVTSLFGTLGLPQIAMHWVKSHIFVYLAFVSVALVLHAVLPSIFKEAPSDEDQRAVGFKTPLIILMFLLTASAVVAQDPTNVYGAGIAMNANPSGVGSLFYARRVSDSGTYAFTNMLIVPTGTNPFTVTNNIGVGVAQKITTIGKLGIFCPTTAGISWTGQNTGFQYNGGCLATFRLKDGLYIMPGGAFIKSNVSDGAGYQPIIALHIAFGS